jgi:hypothetical protein
MLRASRHPPVGGLAPLAGRANSEAVGSVSNQATMSLSEKDSACPVCARPMRLLTIFHREPREHMYVLQCRSCGLSTTKTIETSEEAQGTL